MANTTGSRKIDRILDLAREGGLEVEVETETREDDLLGRRDTFSVSIRRPRVEAENALDMVRNNEWIAVLWVWYRGNGTTPKMAFAKQYGLFSDRELTATILPYTVKGMIER